MIDTMSNNSKLPGYADFTCEVFCHLSNQIHRHIRVMLELVVYMFLTLYVYKII